MYYIFKTIDKRKEKKNQPPKSSTQKKNIDINSSHSILLYDNHAIIHTHMHTFSVMWKSHFEPKKKKNTPERDRFDNARWRIWALIRLIFTLYSHSSLFTSSIIFTTVSLSIIRVFFLFFHSIQFNSFHFISFIHGQHHFHFFFIHSFHDIIPNNSPKEKK